jgi:hypothetical protein
MSQAMDLDRLVSEWLGDSSGGYASVAVVDAALERARRTTQRRGFAAAILGPGSWPAERGRFGLSALAPVARLGILAALLVGLVGGMLLVGGSRRPSPPPTHPQRLAFVRGTELFVAGLDGSDPRLVADTRLLYPTLSPGGDPAACDTCGVHAFTTILWSPAGDRIAAGVLQSSVGIDRIVVVPTDGGQVQHINWQARFAWGHDDVLVSAMWHHPIPEGVELDGIGRLFYARLPIDRPEYLDAAGPAQDGGTVVVLQDAFHANGSWGIDPSLTIRILHVDAAGTTVQELAVVHGMAAGAAISGDGTAVALSINQGEQPSSAVCDGAASCVTLITLRGTPATCSIPLASLAPSAPLGDASQAFISWSPAGDRIALLDAGNANAGYSVVSDACSIIGTTVELPGGNTWGPVRWTADATRILFLWDRAVVEVAIGTARPVVELVADVDTFDLSAP